MKQGLASVRRQDPPVRMRTLASVVLAALLGPLALPAAHAGQLQQLQSEIDALNAKLQQLVAQQAHEQQQQQALAQAQQKVQASVAAAAAAPAGPALTPTRAEAMSGQVVTKGTMPGSFLVPGTNTSIHVGGFVNFQGIYDPTENLGPKFSIGNLTPPGSSSRAQSRRTFHEWRSGSGGSRYTVMSKQARAIRVCRGSRPSTITKSRGSTSSGRTSSPVEWS